MRKPSTSSQLPTLPNTTYPDMVPMRFELRPKDKSVSLRLPEKLLTAVRSRAKRAGIPYQRFIRMALEQAVQEPMRKGRAG